MPHRRQHRTGVTYALFGDGHIGIDTIGSGVEASGPKKPLKPKPPELVTYTSEQHPKNANGELGPVADELFKFLSGLGNDVSVNPVEELYRLPNDPHLLLS